MTDFERELLQKIEKLCKELEKISYELAQANETDHFEIAKGYKDSAL